MAGAARLDRRPRAVGTDGIGAIIALAGLVTTSAGRRALIKGGTNVNPSLPTTQLVTDGVFGYSRNPLYVGICVALCGSR